jgi:NADH-quinone oxidoreductase subunit N
LIPILPLIILTAATVVIMLVISIYRNHRLTFSLTIAAVGLAFFALLTFSSKAESGVTPLLLIDSYALFYMGLLLLSALTVTLFSYEYLGGRTDQPEEYYLLLLIATLGSLVLVSSAHFASFFLGLEVLSVSLYALIAYDRRPPATEGGLKYLILAAFSASFLLFGMALIYAQLGAMRIPQVMSKLASAGMTNPILVVALVMIIIGVGFKLALVPFHMWAPDVYQAAPLPIAAYIATVSKGAVFGLMLRYFADMDMNAQSPLGLILTVIAIASMFAGNLLALFQENIKRMLAYSSIAHLGYLLVAFLSSGPLRVTAVTFYLVAYCAMTLGAFGVITALSSPERDADDIIDYHGLFTRRPGLAGIFTIMLLGLGGLPLTAGFIGKFYIVTAAVGSSLWLPVIILIINSAMSLFYYVRVIAVMYVREPATILVAPARFTMHGVVLAALLVVLVWLGVNPSPLLEVIQAIRFGAG